VGDERPAGVPVTADDVQHTRRQELRGDPSQQETRHGRVSAGLSTTVFPAAIAGATFHTAIISG
jgi:hypothetical protein